MSLLQLGVAQRRADVPMAEDALDDLYALALREEFGAAGVAQLVGRVWRT